MDHVGKLPVDTDNRPQYAPPTISSLREEDVLEQVGPAQAYTGTLPFGF